jgi:hypothetical protein
MESRREVDVDEFASHLASGLEAQEYTKYFGHHGPRPGIGGTDPDPAEPMALPDLEPEDSAEGG